MKRFTILIALLMVFAGCTGAPPAGQTGGVPSVGQEAHPEYQTTDIMSVAGLVESNLSHFFLDNINVQIYGQETQLVPVKARLTSLENEFPQLVLEAQQDASLGNTIFSDIKQKDAYLYIEPQSPSNIWIEVSVYEFKDPGSAKTVYDLYTRVWNTLNWEFDNGSVWVWEGWKQQVSSGQPNSRYKAGAYCSWDPASRSVIFADQGMTNQILTSPQVEFFCLHGIQSKGAYFVMIDVHASPAIIDEVGRASFEQLIPHMFNFTVNETIEVIPSVITTPVSNVSGNVSTNVSVGDTTVIVISDKDKQIRELQDQMIELTRQKLAGEIADDQFNRIFEILDGRLKELEGA